MVSIWIRVDVGQTVRDLSKVAPDLVRRATGDSLRSTGIRVTKAAKENLVGTRYGQYPINAFGGLLSATTFKVSQGKRISKVEVGPLAGQRGPTGNPRHYGTYVHGGRQAGKMPPAKKLELWVQRKLGVSGKKNIQRAAFFVARKQRFLPLPPKPFILDAFVDNAADIIRIFERNYDTAARRANAL